MSDCPIFRKNTEVDRVNIQRVAEQKAYKANNVQQVRQRKKKRILPPVLRGLMGEANLRFAKGEVDLAAKMCMEIIRQVFSLICFPNISIRTSVFLPFENSKSEYVSIFTDFFLDKYHALRNHFKR